uniref:Ig-like domain-containing protein n=1 Tax=Cyprinus carpio TaxID=7962 RepID=A0A8C1LNY0_CYPCA
MKMIYPVLLYCMCLWHPVGVFGDTGEVKPVSVMEGESVTLHTDVAELKKDDEIEWRFNGTRIAKANIPEYENDERFRDRLKLDQTGSLTITNTRTTDSGDYKLSIIAGTKDITKRFSVIVHAVTASGPQTPPHSPDSVPLTVLISAAAGFLLIVAAVVMFWICWKKRAEQEDQTRGEEITYANPTYYKINAQKVVRQYMF